MNSSAQASEDDSSSLRLNLNDLGTCPSEPEPESIALGVIRELKEEEEDMSTDLRVGFKKRHHKRLHEAIDMVPPSQKGLPGGCSGGTRERGSSNANASTRCYGA